MSIYVKLPCPFCGSQILDSTNREQEQVGARREYFFVACDLCQACGPTDFNRDGAIKLWNRRSDADDNN